MITVLGNEWNSGNAALPVVAVRITRDIHLEWLEGARGNLSRARLITDAAGADAEPPFDGFRRPRIRTAQRRAAIQRREPRHVYRCRQAVRDGHVQRQTAGEAVGRGRALATYRQH